jgi:hypothetical protein
MDMSGSQTIPAPRETVWQALNDPEVLKQSIPGCEGISQQSDTEMTAKVTAKVGPVKAKFTGTVTLTDLNPPESYTISGEGKGGAAGFAKGGATVHLEQQEDGQTLMSYEVKANVGGKLAQLGSRLIDGTAKRMADEFFTNFATILRERGEAVDANQELAAAREETSAGVGEAAAATAAVETPAPTAADTAPPQQGTTRVDDEREDESRHGEPGDMGGQRERDEHLTDEEKARADAAEVAMAQAPVTPSNPEQANIQPPSTAPGGLPQGLNPIVWIVALIILVAIIVFLVT